MSEDGKTKTDYREKWQNVEENNIEEKGSKRVRSRERDKGTGEILALFNKRSTLIQKVNRTCDPCCKTVLPSYGQCRLLSHKFMLE